MNERRDLIVTMKKRPVVGRANRWQSHQWIVAAVREAQAVALAEDLQTDGDEGFEFGGLALALHPSEGEGYWLNLHSPTPCVFVMWRQEADEPPTPWVATLSYNEAGRMLDAGEKVENVPLSESLRAWLQTFTDAHYKPEPRKKVKRNDPFKDGAFRREAEPS